MRGKWLLPAVFLPLLTQAQFFDKAIDAIRADQPPVIDGNLEDEAWKSAAVITDLHQLEPEEYGTPTEPTEYRVLYDAENLYVSARLHYSDIGMLTANIMTPRQRVFRDDRIVIMLDPFMSRRNGYLFESNAHGIQGDALLENNSQRINEWTGVFEVASAIDDEGWSIEFRIPFSTISFDPQREDWGFNVYRDLKRTQERLAWSSQGRQELTEAPGAAGTLRGLKGLKPGLGLDLVPSVSLKTQKDFVTGLDDSSFEPSLDVTYRMTPSLTGKLTLNTDFSATEVDDVQVNLTRFSLFFPEKREFFLQDAGIFEFAKLQGNGRPFFSRTIGLGEDGEPLNLNAGAKLTGRVGDWNVGFLGVQQESSTTLGERDLFVVRAVANVFSESSVGLMVTDGDPQNLRDARTAGLDFRYRNSSFLGSNIFQGELWYQQTDNQPVPGEPASSVGSDNNAWGIHALLPNDHHRFDVSYYRFGKNFDPALGFVNRPGIKDIFFNYRHRNRQEGTAWQFHDQQISIRQIKSTYNSELTERINFVPWSAQTRKSDQFQVFFKREREVLVEGFSLFDLIPVQAGNYEYMRYGAYAETAEYRVLQAEVLAEFGDFLDGTREKLSVELRWKPSARFNFSVDYETNKVELPSGKFTARVMSLKSSIAFNSKWSFIPLFQFDNVSEELGINLRLRYHPMRGSDFYFVWSRSMLRDLEDRFHSTFQESVVKGTYTFRF
jgi:hypothetical protein